MTKVNQKTATVNTILSVLENRGVSYELGGEVIMSEILTSDDKSKVRDILFTMFKSGAVEYKEAFQEKVDNDSELKKYISGLVNNWVKKNKDFNAGQAYKAKNPGSRAGQTDSQIKEMRKLLAVTPDESAKAAIQEAIDKRLAEIQAEKQKDVAIDMSKIDPELLKSLGLSQE